MANWITLEDTKTYLGISGTSQDDRINLIIPGIQAMIENIIGDISLGDKTDKVNLCDINSLGEIFLCFSEIASIKKINGTDYVGILNTDYIIEHNKVTVNDVSLYLTDLKFKSVDIIYSAGYDPIPADIQNVMYILVGQELNKKEGGLIKRYTLGPRTVELDNTNGQADGLINSVNAVLSKYIIFKLP